MIADAIRKLLSPKAAPTRATLEKAIRDAQIEHDRAAAAVDALKIDRRNILLTEADSVAAIHDEKIAIEQRAADRAAALVETLDAKLAETIERERVEQIVKERKAAEDMVAAGVAALEKYEALANDIVALIKTVEAGEAAAAEFRDRHPDEEQIVGPEGRVRLLPRSERRDLKREKFSAWVYDSSGHIIQEDRLKNLRKLGPTHGMISSEYSANASSVTLRDFYRVTYIPARRAARPEPLSQTVVLPALRPGQPHIQDAKRTLPNLVSLVEQAEEEILPAPTAAADAA